MLPDPEVTVLGADPAHRKHAINGYAFQQDAITSFNGWHLRYRYSIRGVAQDPTAFSWSSSLFTPTLDYLPGIPSTHKHFSYVTYPRLGALDESTMFMSLRDGKAGLGSDHLYLYRSSAGFWEFVGTPLTGVQSNPYVHGWDFRGGRLHVTWVYRGFVHYEGWDDPADTRHKQQAGPNGAENNHNICYAYSEDLGHTWKNGHGKVIADLRKGETIDNSSEGIVAFAIPKGSGLMNQEAQAVDQDGGVHILNRDTLDGINIDI
ncbi:putative dockerin type 1 [Diaporthe ampelina]|uniref:Putative dockerin type 1 n=1 Tax=Diaporthe ampelina TaxID=1214573 RepID=A0A0G2I5U4_9PEZI|nr:putative dockerin type 1 [Diaporthe ampelina]